MGIFGRSQPSEAALARQAEQERKKREQAKIRQAEERQARQERQERAERREREGVSAQPAQLVSFGQVELRRTASRPMTLRHTGLGESHGLRGARATIEAGEALQQRITATRIVLTGVFALAWRKKSGGESWLTIEGPNYFWVEKVERGQMEQARTFAARVNSEAARAN